VALQNRVNKFGFHMSITRWCACLLPITFHFTFQTNKKKNKRKKRNYTNTTILLLIWHSKYYNTYLCLNTPNKYTVDIGQVISDLEKKPSIYLMRKHIPTESNYIYILYMCYIVGKPAKPRDRRNNQTAWDVAHEIRIKSALKPRRSSDDRFA
jgi:hypothetical protein